LVDDPPTNTQRKAAEQIGKRLFAMNAAAIKASHGTLPQWPVFKIRRLGRRNPGRAVQSNALSAAPSLRGLGAERAPLQRIEPGRR
jgi:hypothetical protein